MQLTTDCFLSRYQQQARVLTPPGKGRKPPFCFCIEDWTNAKVSCWKYVIMTHTETQDSLLLEQGIELSANAETPLFCQGFSPPTFHFTGILYIEKMAIMIQLNIQKHIKTATF